jgi:hypothetical protein
LYLAKQFVWRGSNPFEVRLPQDFNLTLGDYEVENADPEVDKS